MTPGALLYVNQATTYNRFFLSFPVLFHTSATKMEYPLHFGTIGLVPRQNFYGRQAVAHAACHPLSTTLTESKGAVTLLLFGASVVAGSYQNDNACKIELP